MSEVIDVDVPFTTAERPETGASCRRTAGGTR